MFGFHELATQANLKQTQLKIILFDLMEQGIVRETIYDGQKKYEYIFNTQPLDTLVFEELSSVKLKELDNMIEYAETTASRMQFLCDYLGDVSNHSFTNCDNTGQKKIKIIIKPEWIEKLNDFQESFFPVLEVATNKSNLTDGVAASYYGLSNVGSIIHQSKYGEGADFFRLTFKVLE